ncbi:MAG: histidinol-phosphatase HisJ family protein [Anaerolineales bacterium]|nr:histidinol-phosphatase HisJ family protein [Anaerolineales bacterium]
MTIHDYHIHTHFSCDSKISMHQACKSALSSSIFEIGFCDHYDLIPADPCFDYFRADGFWEELMACREAYKGQITIRAGIEIGEPHLFPNQIEHMLSAYPWDYALGSLHWVGDQIVFESSYFHQSEDSAYRNYFRALQELVLGGQFDILAHMDVVKRSGFDYYNSYQPLRYEEEIRNVLRTLADRDLALEINTSALHRGVHDFCPAPIIVEWFREEGGHWITLGSDSHRLPQIGRGIQEASALAKSIGFEHIASFQLRAPSPLV